MNMIHGKKILGLIPARGGSRGLPGKNIKKLCGKPVIAWTILAAQGSRYLDDLVFSTDSPEIAKVARRWGVEVPFLRPGELAQDDTESSAVLIHALDFLEAEGRKYDYVILLEPTSPLRETSDIDRGMEVLDEFHDRADSIVSVCRVEAAHPVFDVRINDQGLLQTYLPQDDFQPLRRQDIEELYFFEGTIYISKTDAYREKKTFYHQRTLPYIVPKEKSLELDDRMDFICIEALLRNRLKKTRPSAAPARS